MNRNRIAAIIIALSIGAAWQPLKVAGGQTAPAVSDELDTSKTNLLTNPSFEKPATITDEASLPGWEIFFRRGTDQPLLTPEEISVIEDPKQAHSGRRFLRMQTRREMWIHSPRTNGFEPGVYEISAWVRGRPGTIAAFGIDALGAMFGAGIQGVDDQWKKFSLTVYCKGIKGPGQWPEQSQLLVAVFPPGQRGQIANPMLDIDDVSISRLSSGLADTFSDHMVLQRDRSVPIRGWAKDPGQRVTVEFNGQTRAAIADSDGRWQTMLDPMKAGGPYVLKLDGRPTAFDVMVGDVWICSGQSNMEFGIDKLNGQWNHAPEEIAKANQPQIRLWQAPKQFSATPMHSYLMHQSAYPNDYQARWEVCSPATVGNGVWGGFSAVGYFFGREIQADQKVAIGLMMIANGGTQIESFISEEGLRGIPREQWVVPPITHEAIDHLKNPPFPKLPEGVTSPSAGYAEVVAEHAGSRQGSPDQNSFHYASAAFNGLMSPVFPFAVRGVIWYQGEHNGNDAHYEAKLKALIADWRARFGQEGLPFIIAQLPYWRTGEPAHWQLVREAQLRVSQTVPKTGLAVTLDLADKEGDGYGIGEIHPRRKLEVGQRMALAARAVAYGEKLVSAGPIYRTMKIDGGRIRLEFDSIGGGLESRGGKLVGFQIAGSDKKFTDAEATMVGDSIVVSSQAVPAPVAVRYGFAQFMLPAPNLYNKEGLPAPSFRTDDWAVE